MTAESKSSSARPINEQRQILRRTFASLQHPKFRIFFWSQLVSASGEWVQIAAVNILVLRLSGGGNELAIANLSAFIPLILLTPIAGILADTRDKVSLLLYSNSALVAITIVFGMLVQTHAISLPLVYAIAAVSGSLTAFDVTARQALVGDLVPLSDLGNGVGLNVTSMTVARAVGPFGAAALVPLLGIPGCLYTNAASYFALLVFLPRLRAPRNDIVRQLLPRINLVANAQVIWSDRSLRTPLLQIAILSGFGVTSTVLLPLFVVQALHSQGWTYAALAGVVGIGSVIGGLSAATLQRAGTRTVVILSACLAVMLAIIGTSSSPAIAVLPLFLSGIFAAAAIATTLSAMQTAAAPPMRGRVVAAYTAVFTLSTGVASPATGFIANATSPRIGYYICTAAVAASALLIQIRTVNSENAGREEEI